MSKPPTISKEITVVSIAEVTYATDPTAVALKIDTQFIDFADLSETDNSLSYVVHNLTLNEAKDLVQQMTAAISEAEIVLFCKPRSACPNA